MNIPVGGDVGHEVHTKEDQFLRQGGAGALRAADNGDVDVAKSINAGGGKLPERRG